MNRPGKTGMTESKAAKEKREREETKAAAEVISSSNFLPSLTLTSIHRPMANLLLPRRAVSVPVRRRTNQRKRLLLPRRAEPRRLSKLKSRTKSPSRLQRKPEPRRLRKLKHQTRKPPPHRRKPKPKRPSRPKLLTTNLLSLQRRPEAKPRRSSNPSQQLKRMSQRHPRKLQPKQRRLL